MSIKHKWPMLISLSLIQLSAYAQQQKDVPIAQSLTKFDDKKPVFNLTREQLENKNRHLHFYALTGYREGVKPIIAQFDMNFLAQKDTVQGTHRIKMYNLSITDMLTQGLTKPEEVILEVKDPSKYRYDPKYGTKVSWLRKNAYCYELLLPENALKDMDTVTEHLSHLFKVKCGYQKRLIKTVITKNGTSEESNVEKEVFVITEIN